MATGTNWTLRLSNPWLLIASVKAATIPQTNPNIIAAEKGVPSAYNPIEANSILVIATEIEPSMLLVTGTPNRDGTLYLCLPHLVPTGSPIASPMPTIKYPIIANLSNRILPINPPNAVIIKGINMNLLFCAPSVVLAIAL